MSGKEASVTANDGTRAPKGRAPHRRDENARIAVLHAADDLLVERGYRGVTIEGIAGRAGVAKQTIYRWWSSKFDVLLDTLIEDAGRRLAVPSAGSALDATRSYLRALAVFLTSEDAGKVMLALIGEAQHDPEAAAAFRDRYQVPQRERERALLTGALSAGADADAVLDALTGPIFYRALSGAEIPASFVEILITANLIPRLASLLLP